MEQKLIVCNLPEKKAFELTELTKGTVLTLAEDLTVKVMGLSNEKLEFSIGHETYTLNRQWQVLHIKGTLCYFSSEKKSKESQFDRLKKTFDDMCTNLENGDDWKNIVLAKEAMEVVKDEAPDTDLETLKEFCEAVVDEGFLDRYNTPRLLLSYMEYYHILSGDLQHWEKENSQLVRLIDPKVSDEEKIEIMRESRRVFDPIQFTQQWEDMITDARREYREYILSHMHNKGFNHMLGSVWKSILKKRGIENWRTPASMH